MEWVKMSREVEFRTFAVWEQRRQVLAMLMHCFHPRNSDLFEIVPIMQGGTAI